MDTSRQTWVPVVLSVLLSARLGLAQAPVVNTERASATNWVSAQITDSVPAPSTASVVDHATLTYQQLPTNSVVLASVSDSASCDSATCDSAGCDSAGCASGWPGLASVFGCTPCCTWTADVGVMFLDRSSPDSVPLIRNQGTGDVLLNAQDMDYGWGGFPYVRLGQMCGCNGWDVGYFGGDPWQDDRQAGGEISPVFVGAGLVVGSTAPFAVFNVSTGTELHTVDINYRRVIGPNSTLVAGFRWLELSDSIDISRSQDGVTEPILHTDTNNQLYGFQLGLDTLLWRSSHRWSVYSSLRGALMANHADQTSSSPYVTGVPGFVDYVTATDDTTGFFGGLGLLGQYRLTSACSLVAGYQFFWLESVALAPSQIRVTDFQVPGTATVDTSSGLFLNGATIGLNYQF